MCIEAMLNTSSGGHPSSKVTLLRLWLPLRGNEDAVSQDIRPEWVLYLRVSIVVTDRLGSPVRPERQFRLGVQSRVAAGRQILRIG